MEPGVLVGCVIVPSGEPLEVASIDEARSLVTAGRVALAHHRAFGGPHAEVEALDACRRLGLETRGATVFVTLEPCDHWGKTGPCSRALAEARVGRVVCAREDPSPTASGGAKTLGNERIEVVFTGASTRAVALSDPFVHRVRTGRPWVIAKWAQTLDGKGATSAGESQWLTGPRARRTVHALRGRVDAILTGVGTVLTDNPALTVRGVAPRRTPMRVIVDPKLETPTDCTLAATARETPTIVVCDEAASASNEKSLTALGVRTIRVPSVDGVLDLRAALERLASDEGVSTVMTEAGPRLMGRLLDARLIEEIRAYVAPMVLGDSAALSSFAGGPVLVLDDAERWRLLGVRRLGDDLELRYRSVP